MQFSFAHNNFNVRDLDRSLSFYKEALGLTESSRINAPDGSFIIVYLTDGVVVHQLVLGRPVAVFNDLALQNRQHGIAAAERAYANPCKCEV